MRGGLVKRRWWRGLARRVESWPGQRFRVMPAVVTMEAGADIETGQMLTLHGWPLGVALGPASKDGVVEVRLCGPGGPEGWS